MNDGTKIIQPYIVGEFFHLFWLSNAPNTILELQQMDAFLNCFLLKEYKFITLLLLLLSRFSHVRLCATP